MEQEEVIVPSESKTGGEEDSGAEDSSEPIVIPEHRSLFDPKYKTYQAVAKTLTEQEKYKSKLENEKGQYMSKVEEYESQIADMQGKLAEFEKKGTLEERTGIEPNELEAANKAFAEEFNTNPVGAMQKFFKFVKDSMKNEQEKGKEEEQGKEFKKQFDSDIKFFADKYKDKWEEMRPQLKKLADERPYINSLRELVAIWKDQQEEKDVVAKKEAEEKDLEKNRAQTESGKGGKLSQGLEKRIEEAKTLEELDQIRKSLRE